MRRLILAFFVCLTCAGCGGAGGVTSEAGTPSRSAPSGPASSSVERSRVVSVGKGPVGLAADADGSVWVAVAGDDRVSRIRGGKVDLDVKGIDVPLRLATAEGVVWATAFGSGELLRIDSVTGAITSRTPVGEGAEGVAVGLGSVWVVVQDAGKLVRVDPATSAVTGTAAIGVGARLVTTGGGAVWVSHYADGTVLRVDPVTLAVTASPRICSGPQGIVASADDVWVACTIDNVVVRLDRKTSSVTARVATPTAPDGLVVGPDSRLRVVAQQGPTLVVIDPGTNVVVSQQTLGAVPQLYDQANLTVAVTADTTWMTSFSEDAVYHLAAG